jgi:DNA-binding response OmpR family regulator
MSAKKKPQKQHARDRGTKKSHESTMRDTSASALIVDDDDIVRNLLVKVLAAADFECIPCENAERALSMLKDHAPVFAILDIAMPGMTGAELAWRIRQTHPDLPLIAVSGKLQVWDVDDLRDLGFDHIYAKPLDCNDLVALCKSIRRSALEESSAGGAA